MTDRFAKHTEFVGKPLTCKVERVFPFGVFVRMPSGKQGYIRRRELTLSGNADPREEVIEGSQLQAIPIKTSGSEKTIELSVRRALPNPWPKFAQQYRVGDVVVATVKHLFADGVLVEILPGVDGYIAARELVIDYPHLKIEDILWLGDHVEAVILAIDARRRRLSLSVRRRLEQIMIAEAVREQLDRAGQEFDAKSENEEPSEAPFSHEERSIRLNGPVLVVEDRDDVREPLITWLHERGCAVAGAASAKEAIELCKSRDFAIGIFDLDIPKVNGLSLIQELRQLRNEMPIAVMSGSDMIVEYWPQLQRLGVVAYFHKPLDLNELIQALQLVGQGYVPKLNSDSLGEGTEDEVAAFNRLAKNVRRKRRLADRLKAILDQLINDTGVDKGIIFHLDPVSHHVSIVAEAGKQQLNDEALYRLPDSPVKDIIREPLVLIKGEVSQDRVGRLQNLLPLLAFESFIGIPLEAGGHIEHALFLFSQKPRAFPQQAIRHAFSAAYLTQAILENQILEQRLGMASGILLSGQLSSAFGHEVYNRISSIDLQIRLLSSDLDQLDERAAKTALRNKYLSVKRSVAETNRSVANLRRTASDFRRLMRVTDEQSVDLNEALRDAETQIKLIAARRDVDICLNLASDLPKAQGSSTRIQQVFLNLMLNAIQQMDGDNSRRRALCINTRLSEDEVGTRIQVQFADTGPGIHQQLWEKIFALGFTTRKDGSGLGLFIARSLVESMGGSISVEESLITLGTTFLIDLPVAA